MTRDSDHVFVNAPNTFKITYEEMKATKDESLDAQAIRLAATQHLDDQAK